MVEYDTPQDIELDANREIEIGSDGDISLVDGVALIKQSTVVYAGSVLRPLIGEPVTGNIINDVEAELRKSLDDNPYLDDDVRRVSVDRIYKDANRIEVSVQTSADEDLALTLQP